ncbi:MAG TPA: hypothetical protein VLU46_03975, partial [Thermoanaerobaculia bacterium]|nr:hypothetical protein [Thermoanaerobaculia bacterium]
TNPAAAPMVMPAWENGTWSVMVHGSAFVNQMWQSGPRGGDKLFSTNWVMGMADRPLGGGHLMLRGMFSLEPATITNRRYPELFQTGETAYGQPLRDAQHPHDFFMELAAEYAYAIAPGTIGYVYAAPVGDPSLGPVAFPHRASAQELPQATLAHHTEDSTHIAASVVTIGAKRGIFGAALSGFHGGEPDENRWNIDTGAIDSWAVRLTADPTKNWTAQISTGHLRRPERLEPGNVQRTTASVAYSVPNWSSSLIFGHNDKSSGASTNAWTAETLYQLMEKNWLTARGEIVDKDELFGDGTVHTIKALTLGYTRDLVTNATLIGGVGGNVTFYSVPAAIRPAYGSSPHSFYLYVRVRSAAMSM